MKNRVIMLALAGSLLAPTMALAHGGSTSHAHGALLDGLLHPFTGADHLAAMLAVGVWSALSVRPIWLAPAAFVVMLVIGAWAGFLGVAIPAVEPMIAASLLVIGLLIAGRRALPVALAAGVAGLFAFFHGAAHGMELGGEGRWLALAGLVAGTALLHATGIALGRLMRMRQPWVASSAGGAVALLGSALLVRLV